MSGDWQASLVVTLLTLCLTCHLLSLQAYQLFLPFLEPLRTGEQVGLHLATGIYLASLKTDLVGLQVDLLHAIREQTLLCISRGPSDPGEVAALVALALYEPLLLVDSSRKLQLDGSGLLPAASSGAKMLDLEETPLLMRDFDWQSHRDPSGLLRRGSLWITIALYTGFNKLAGNATQRQGIECNREDLHQVEMYCKRSLEVYDASQWAEQASMLYLVTFRYRTLKEFQDLIIRQLSILEGIPLSAHDRAEACMVDGVDRAFSFSRDVLNQLPSLRQSLGEDRWIDLCFFLWSTDKILPSHPSPAQTDLRSCSRLHRIRDAAVPYALHSQLNRSLHSPRRHLLWPPN